jgi:hypothetical protein
VTLRYRKLLISIMIIIIINQFIFKSFSCVVDNLGSHRVRSKLNLALIIIFKVKMNFNIN